MIIRTQFAKALAFYSASLMAGVVVAVFQAEDAKAESLEQLRGIAQLVLQTPVKLVPTIEWRKLESPKPGYKRYGQVSFDDPTVIVLNPELVNLSTPMGQATYLHEYIHVLQLATQRWTNRLCESQMMEVEAHKIAGTWYSITTGTPWTGNTNAIHEYLEQCSKLLTH